MRLTEHHQRGSWADDPVHRIESVASIGRGGGLVVSTHQVGPDRVQVITDVGEPLTTVRVTGEGQLARHAGVTVARSMAREVRP